MVILNKKNIQIIVTTAFLLTSMTVFAQSDNTDNEVESLYDTFDKEEDNRERTELRKVIKKETRTLKKLEDLIDLAPFEDVAVIQRRYLPKTGRFDVDITAIGGLNNAFFNNVVV